jgi:hypothetical protein
MPDNSTAMSGTCETCGKPVSGHQKRYCSHSCFLARRPAVLQQKHPTVEYKGTIYHLQKNGYYQAYRPHGLLHQAIWEDSFGPIPEGYLVRHKDGDHTNNTPDNLQLVTFSELRTRKPKRTCLKCDRPARSRGLCARHYNSLNIEERGGWAIVGAANQARARAKRLPQEKGTADDT